MIFATFNGLALIHIFLAAPETKGKTLEEMDIVFDSGKWPWQGVPKGSRLEELEKDIEKGAVQVKAPVLNDARQDSVDQVAGVEEQSYKSKA